MLKEIPKIYHNVCNVMLVTIWIHVREFVTLMLLDVRSISLDPNANNVNKTTTFF